MDRKRILYEGILVGLAGAAAVAIWFFLYDLAAGTPFRTPALLGAAPFEGLRDTAALTIAPSIVLKYMALHALIFIVFGEWPWVHGCSTRSTHGRSSLGISSQR